MGPSPAGIGVGTAGWLSDEQELGRYIRSLDVASSARQERVISEHARKSDSAGSSEANEGIARRRNPQAVFARWGGSDSDGMDGVPAAAAPQSKNRGKAGDSTGASRPTNVWR